MPIVLRPAIAYVIEQCRGSRDTHSVAQRRRITESSAQLGIPSRFERGPEDPGLGPKSAFVLDSKLSDPQIGS